MLSKRLPTLVAVLGLAACSPSMTSPSERAEIATPTQSEEDAVGEQQEPVRTDPRKLF